MYTKRSSSQFYKSLAIAILGLILSLVITGNVPIAHAQEATTDSSLQVNSFNAIVSISTDSTSFETEEDVVIHVGITNPNDYPIQILKWLTPAEGIEEPLFSIMADGEPVAYIGALYKRLTPTDQDYITLEPGEELNRDVNLSAVYDFATSGNYEVTYDVTSSVLFWDGENKKSRIAGSLISNSLNLVIEGRPAPVLEEFAPLFVSGTNSFVSCNATRQSILATARLNANTYANEALTYFNANNHGQRYTTWFGVYDAGRYNTVKNHFTNIRNVTNNASVLFNCGCTMSNVYAYVYPSQPYKIYLCGAFWSAPTVGTDSQAGTLIHEISHFTVVAGTTDYVYGQTGARNLAISNPSRAIMNADNHEYFAENNPPIYEINPDNYEPDNTYSQAKSIAAGNKQIHNIFPATDIDWIKFQLTSPAAISLETSGTSASDTRMWLYDSNLNELSYNDDKGGGDLYSYINTCYDSSPILPAGTYYVMIDEYFNDAVITSYNISFNSGSNCVDVDVYVGGVYQGYYTQLSENAGQFSMPDLNDGPVRVSSFGGENLVSSERVVWGAGFDELMGYPADKLTNEYVFPWYNNKAMNSQLRIGNTGDVAADVDIYIGGTKMNIAPYNILVGGSLRVQYAGVNAGPVRVVTSTSGATILASQRVIWGAGYDELMGYPADQLTNEYVFPWYNNKAMSSQLRIGNTGTVAADVDVYIGGTKMNTTPYNIAVGGSLRVEYAGINNGPVRVVTTTSGASILATMRVLWGAGYDELMGFAANQLTNEYVFPMYSNTSLDTQVRVGNTGNVAANVDVYVGSTKMNSTPYSIPIGGSIRLDYTGIEAGPLRVVTNTSGAKILATERIIHGSTGYDELMGYPASQLRAEYLFPWYNNIAMQTSITIGVP